MTGKRQYGFTNAEYAVMNFTAVDPYNVTYGSQASLMQIEIFMDVTRSFMDSVDWVERYFYFGAMYDMQGVNPFNTMFEPSGREKRTGALNALGVQYARVNGSVDPNGQIQTGAGMVRREIGGAVLFVAIAMMMTLC